MVRTKTMDSLLNSKRKMEKRDYTSYQFDYGESVSQMHQQYGLSSPPLLLHQTSSLGADLNHLDAERSIKSDPEDNRKRRTLLLQKHNQSWGFTLQTYGIKNKKTNEVEVMTYVDYIDYNSSAYIAGLRTGDVILSVNGQSMEVATHSELVSAIKLSGDQLRLVVLFEDCVHKVELYDRIIRLKRVVTSKMKELRDLEFQEREILDRYCESKGISRYDKIRQSVYSTTSSSSWDRYSVLSSQAVGNFPRVQHHIPKVMITGDRFSDVVRCDDDTGSLLSDTLGFDDTYCDISYADSDSDSVSGLRFTCDGHSIKSDSVGSGQNLTGPTGPVCSPSQGQRVPLSPISSSSPQGHTIYDSNDQSMDQLGAYGPIDITFNPLMSHDIRKIKSEGHMETLECKSSRKSMQNLKHSNKLQVPNSTNYGSKQMLAEQRCGSFRSLQEHSRNKYDRSEVKGSRSELRKHKQLSLNSLEETPIEDFCINEVNKENIKENTNLDTKPAADRSCLEHHISENVENSITIPFLHVGPVHINERNEDTKL